MYYTINNMHNRLVALLCLLILPFSAWADSLGTPVVYTKTIIKIIPASSLDKTNTESKLEPADNKKAQDSNTTDLMPALQRVAKEFTVEVRPLSFLDQEGFLVHQPFTDKEGMLLLVDPPAPAQLKSSNLLGKVDVLFILENGTIEKIAPDLALRELPEPILTQKPVRAFVFLQSGMAETSDIKPGDRVDNPLFKNNSVIILQ